jgi:hypothetical protein
MCYVNTALEKAVRVAGSDIRGTTLHTSVQVLACEDDIVIIGRYERAVNEVFTKLETAPRRWG